MTISNSDDFKKKMKSALPAISIFFGTIFLLISFVIFWNGYLNYNTQIKQQDWQVTSATVSYVEEEIHSYSRPGKANHRSSTFYNIHYDYAVNEQSYSGTIEGVNYSMNIGDSLEIKYNPNAPEESTYTLQPSKFFILPGSILGGIGLLLIILCFISNKNNKNTRE